MDDRRVSHASELDDFQCTVDALLCGFYFVTGEHRAQFFSGQREFRSHAFDFGYQNFRSGRYVDAAQFGNLRSRLAYDCRVHRAFISNDRASCQLGSFLFVDKITAVRNHFLLHLIENRFFDNDRLLRSTDHAVVKSFG
ncbi:hypothetical protein D3C77_471740 [compost metagenome]